MANDITDRRAMTSAVPPLDRSGAVLLRYGAFGAEHPLPISRVQELHGQAAPTGQIH